MTAGLVVLAAGGTGGHMFPAEALAQALIRRGRSVALVTDRRGKAFPVAGVPTYRVASGRSGGSLLERVRSIVGIAFGTLAASRLLRRLAPRSVVGFGGYPSFPTMLAAARLRLPTIIHEQNAVLGRANRVLAPRMRRIAAAFDSVAGLDRVAPARLVRTGNPVRPGVVALRACLYQPPAKSGIIRVLVIGGSQGARILADIVPAALMSLPEALRQRLSVSHQVRAEDLERTTAAYGSALGQLDLRSFFDDLPARLKAAHLVICRAGGSTVAELTVAGRPAILVPYAAAIADEQSANARVLTERGAGWLLPEPAFTAAALNSLISMLLASPEALAKAAAAAYALGRPDAADALADLVEQVESENS